MKNQKNKMKNQKNETKIAIIGETQSGKTTLAAGLAKTSNEDFTVGFADNATRDYLQPRIAGISAGHWPEATSDEDRDICLNINTSGGRSASIAFKEYMGERIHDATYLEQIVGSPNGALILLSPGMESLRDPEEREELIGNLKGVIDHLKRKKCVAIAFVVTACDRLKTDLKEFKPTFEECVAEVTNYLNTSGMDWKRFEVTITGELQEQDKPSIAVGEDNTSREPFVWILDRVFRKKRMNSAKRILCAASYTILAALILCIAFCGWRYLSDRSTLKAREATFAEINNRITNAWKCEDELKKATDEMHRMIASNDTDSFWYECFKKRLSADNERWLKLYEKNRAQYFSVSIDERVKQETSRGSEDDCRSFDSELAEFCPTDASITNELVASWNEKRPKIREAYDVNHGNDLSGELAKLMQRPKDDDLLRVVAKFKNDVTQWETPFATPGEIKKGILAEICNLENAIYVELDTQKGNAIGTDVDKMNADAAIKAKPEALEALRKRISEWTPLTVAGKVRREGLLKDFKDRESKWRQEYSDRCCTEEADKVVQNIHKLKPDDQSLEADEICTTLKAAYGFSSRYTYATPKTLVAETNKIGEACAVFLSSFLNSFVKVWGVNDRKTPVIDPQNEDFIRGALDVANPAKPDQKLSDDFLKELMDKRTEAEKLWSAARKKDCEDFIAQTFISGRRTMDVFDDYRKWYEKNADNPYVTNVDARVSYEVTCFFDAYVKNYVSEFRGENHVWKSYDTAPGRIAIARRKFDEFKSLCLAVAGRPCGLSNSSRAVAFACLCRDKGEIVKGFDKAFLQNWVISDVEIKVDFEKTDQSFEGLSVGCSLKLAECDSVGNIGQKRFVLWEKKDENKITKQNEGRKFHYYNDKCVFTTNPWKDVYLSIPMTECINWAIDNDYLYTCSIWGLEKGEVVRSCICSQEQFKASVTFFVHGSLEGPTLEGLWAEAGRRGE